MEKSNAERLKEALLYAPVGAFGFVKDNAPTFFSMFVSRGKRDVNKTAAQAEEKITSTKEHGQFVAMGTPVMMTKAEKLTNEAKSKGEDIAQISIEAALGALNFLEGAIKSLAETVASDSESSSSSGKSGYIEATQAHDEDVIKTPKAKTETESEIKKGEGDFVAEPANDLLPANLKTIYAHLSAPEIIDRLDNYVASDLSSIKEYESDNRNRQTIIHAINHRLSKS